MSTTTLKICVEALSLPRQARADLAHRLLISLEAPKPSGASESHGFRIDSSSSSKPATFVSLPSPTFTAIQITGSAA